ncbi:aminoglycoside phosphotransferase family protein [Dactylosporangium vinaceum]|uniref:Aminoglycoside phosphotransferase family protein n=1 Tax=Dactylosporangium vinaceum TaxID=53362 RepID=A0ABV5MM63_9ACTN|nr:aminoglycoside phosphotransferase family protein [Dactylosporangium vinaceum]UAB93324.1 aminoglycoside phosphotransferase family protein [Dactylosporangium vinaceum]
MLADIDVSTALVAGLVREQHPDLDGELRPVAAGWDNAIFRLGADLAVRVPRRQVAAALIEHEQRWLPHLAPRLPLPIPVPVRNGRPTVGYPYPWSITAWITGTVVTAVPVTQRILFAEQLAGFLNALHRPAPPDAPANPVRGVPLATRSEAMAERFASGRVPRLLQKLWTDLTLVPPWPDRPRWVHGDLHAANLLAGPDGRLAAVLDFGDLTAGDPATDLAAAWLVFDAPARARFRGALDVDEDTWQRGRGWALNMAAAIAADPTGAPEMHAMAAHALREVA